MPESTAKKRSHRGAERYECPPFFSARISSGGKVEENAAVENLSLRGLRVRASRSFVEGSSAEIELRSKYAAPIKIRARVTWVKPPKNEGPTHIVGFSISKVRIVDWFRFMRIISQIKKEVW
jgi:hypothetical protein